DLLVHADQIAIAATRQARPERQGRAHAGTREFPEDGAQSGVDVVPSFRPQTALFHDLRGAAHVDRLEVRPHESGAGILTEPLGDGRPQPPGGVGLLLPPAERLALKRNVCLDDAGESVRKWGYRRPFEGE